MQQTERLESFNEALLAALDGRQANIWTTLPGIIEQVNSNGTVVVQPAIKAQVRSPNGTMQWVALPLLLDCPVVYQRGGGCTFTFPIAKNDECLVSFSSRCIDAWWSSGGVQVQSELRMHDLSDGFATVGPFSQATLISNISTTTAQLRSNDGTTYVELDPAGKVVNVVAPGGMTITAPTVTITGVIDVQNQAGETNASTMNGSFAVTGDVVAGTISTTHHIHSDSGGSGNGGPPVPGT